MRGEGAHQAVAGLERGAADDRGGAGLTGDAGDLAVRVAVRGDERHGDPAYAGHLVGLRGQLFGKLTAAEITLRPPGARRIPVPVGEAAGLYASGQTMAQLADMYGVCQTVIYNRLTEAGAPIRHKTDCKQVDASVGLLCRSRVR
jgi:hypothetical protein